MFETEHKMFLWRQISEQLSRSFIILKQKIPTGFRNKGCDGNISPVSENPSFLEEEEDEEEIFDVLKPHFMYENN